jgi:hypothetical protein
MAFPKWKYRKHPTLGVFQSTLVLTAAAEAELDADWSDDPTSTGFEVRKATQLHPDHITDDLLHEVVTDAAGKPLEATIEVTLQGDLSHV